MSAKHVALPGWRDGVAGCLPGRWIVDRGVLCAGILAVAVSPVGAKVTYNGLITNDDGSLVYNWNPTAPTGGVLVIGPTGADANLAVDNLGDGNGVTSLSHSHVYVARGDGSRSTLSMRGAGCAWNVGGNPGNLHLASGVNSRGTFTMSGGIVRVDPTYTNHHVLIGLEAGSFGTMVMSDPGTRLKLADHMYIGHVTSARGRLVVQGGAVCEAARVFVGYQSDSVGEVVVQGAGSVFRSWLNERSAIGWSGNGSLTVRDGGLADIRLMEIAYVAGSRGEVLVTGQGSRLENNYQNIHIALSAGDASAGSEGALRVARGGVAYTNSNCVVGVYNGVSQATLAFIIGNDGGGSVVPGRLDVDGQLSLRHASLEMEVDAGIALSIGQQFTLVDYGARDASWGEFDDVPEDAVVLTPNHHAFRINYATDLGGGDLAITATKVLPPVEDGDGDGMVDAWELRCFGTVSDPASAPELDADGDGCSNLCEHEAGTDPLDPMSRCIVGVAGRPGGSGWDLSYEPYEPGVTYQVEHAVDPSGAWGDVSAPMAVAGATATFELPVPDPGAGHGFYRVRIMR